MAAASGETHVFMSEQAAVATTTGAELIGNAKLQLFGPARTSGALGEWGALENEENRQEFLKRLPAMRRKIGDVLSSGYFEATLGIILLTNFVVAIVETNSAVRGEVAVPTWVAVANIVLLSLYSVEICVRFLVYKSLYFRSAWNLLDLGVVIVDVASHILRRTLGTVPSLSVLRTVRLVRLARAYKVLVVFPELYAMIIGMFSTIKTIFWGMLLLEGFLLFFSLVAVQIVHPVNREIDWGECDRCRRAFATVWDAHKTFTSQIVAGDAWGAVSLPIIEREPWMLIYLGAVLLTINLLVINLITAVIVEKAQEAHAEQSKKVMQLQVKAKEAKIKVAQAELVKLCYAMDEDKSGNLTLEELLVGFDSIEYFSNLLKAMDISRDDLKVVFNILDKDSSGDIDYVEFVDQLHRLKNQDEHTLLIFILHHIKELQANFAKSMGINLHQGLSPKVREHATHEAGSAVEDPMVGLAAKIDELNRTFADQGTELSSITDVSRRLLKSAAAGNRFANGAPSDTNDVSSDTIEANTEWHNVTM
mmetsp:Transcript_70113/g.196452  ORF Transcript_70113/g.196452 Transcript_70113/m.196452 type:complete len:535 (+) Transcript_70113:46-1650(+)